MEGNKYEGFTLSLALVDAVPVIFFGLSSIVLGLIFGKPLFIIGAVMCFLAGFMKVMWKVILATKNKDIPFLNKQLRVLMPAGFALILISVLANIKSISFKGIIASVIGFPQCVFFAVWVLGMIGMGVLAKKLDSKVARNNWIEQCVNGVAQISLFIALLIAR